MGTDRPGGTARGKVITDPDFWHIVTFDDGRISKCYTWFQAYNELAVPGKSGSIKYRGVVVVRKSLGGRWEWSTQSSREPGFDLDVEEK